MLRNNLPSIVALQENIETAPRYLREKIRAITAIGTDSSIQTQETIALDPTNLSTQKILVDMENSGKPVWKPINEIDLYRDTYISNIYSVYDFAQSEYIVNHIEDLNFI